VRVTFSRKVPAPSGDNAEARSWWFAARNQH
jgi:hypothetical protein